MQTVIDIRDLTLYYGRHLGIEEVTMTVEQGEVFGFLGPNGAGKTTTQRVLMDVIRADQGKASIFGLDSRADGVEIRKRVGYLPGELSLPDTLTGRQFLEVMGSVRGMKDKKYRDELTERLDLDPSRHLKQYSRGNKQKVGLVAAMMHKPDLLILDEPTSGLDPLVQQTILELVRETRDEGRTVFFSSHILPEVQAVCDRVGIIRAGKLVAVEWVDALIGQQFRRLRLSLQKAPSPNAFNLDGVREIGREGTAITLEIQRNMQAVMVTAVQIGVIDIEEHPVTLEDIFLAFYGGNSRKGANHV
ncbi:MAG: ABC transporter ATP-binding protein [Caldilineaceae bacterium]|nr:ABC transporter ATP-binding protein [Caldilineaceae bacterium]MBP8123316.1 ABC transporter ATP-binding protein [Caldilineaceae bacterium]MBP9074323.1 ABC transporter ATP-binding protein [Caldilineaceae bacterium]